MDITIPDISRDTDRGQVGIETLIIFIAMILVAAIAASVLINTAGYLQNQASATSEDSESQVSNQVLVLSSIGDIDTEYGPEMASENVTFQFDNSSGANLLKYVDNDNGLDFTSDRGDLNIDATGGEDTNITDTSDFEAGDAVDLDDDEIDYSTGDDIIVTWTPEEGSETEWVVNASDLTEAGTESQEETINYRTRASTQISDLSMTVMQSPGANEIDLEGASVEYIGPDGEETLSYSDGNPSVGEFTVEGTTDNDNTAPVLTSRQDRFTMHIGLIEDENEDLRHLEEGEEATIRIVTQSGSVATAVINVPESLSSYDGGDAVEL